ncbi:hypothetical protein ACFYN0_26405 [Streptomyces sp. NPDC006704]|uniref:hypothetical protein n=1 Tax=Streptomyces sp. NPDC006704 TaxID=3364760 RepID=UPI0036780582
MAYINVGASASGARIASKAALKRALASDPASVAFDRTAAVGVDAGQPDIKGDALPEGAKLSVTGPDPYNNRRWYATVYLSSTGKITVN